MRLVRWAAVAAAAISLGLAANQSPASASDAIFNTTASRDCTSGVVTITAVHNPAFGSVPAEFVLNITQVSYAANGVVGTPSSSLVGTYTGWPFTVTGTVTIPAEATQLWIDATYSYTFQGNRVSYPTTVPVGISACAPPEPVESTEPTVEPVDTTEPPADPVDTTDSPGDPVDTTEPSADPIDTTEPPADPVDTREPAAEPVHMSGEASPPAVVPPGVQNRPPTAQVASAGSEQSAGHRPVTTGQLPRTGNNGVIAAVSAAVLLTGIGLVGVTRRRIDG